MNRPTIVVAGGGHAGLHALANIREALGEQASTRYRLVLVDRQSCHVRKVMLFKGAVRPAGIRVPFSSVFGEAVEVIQAAVTGVDPGARTLQLTYPDGHPGFLQYDRLVLALGSVVAEVPPEQGGICLTGPEAAERIRLELEGSVAAAATADPPRRRHLLTAAVVGGGLSGVETAAEVAEWLRERARALGLDLAQAEVYLLDAGERLFPQAPPKVGARVERVLARLGVTVRHGTRAERFEGGFLHLEGGGAIPAACCIWTIGTRPSPVLPHLGLPLAADGRLQVDPWYRVFGTRGVYALGDCARVTDHRTGAPDGMTCKEMVPQAWRLGHILAADLAVRPLPPELRHRSWPLHFWSIGLGSQDGVLWINKWGMHFVLSGAVVHKIKMRSWDTASLLDSASRRRFGTYPKVEPAAAVLRDGPT